MKLEDVMTYKTWDTPNGKIRALLAKEISTPSMIGTELDRGNVYTETRKGTLWQVRRNGKTKTWKRDPERFEIPAKAGFRDCFTIDNQLRYLWIKVDD